MATRPHFEDIAEFAQAFTADDTVRDAQCGGDGPHYRYYIVPVEDTDHLVIAPWRGGRCYEIADLIDETHPTHVAVKRTAEARTRRRTRSRAVTSIPTRDDVLDAVARIEPATVMQVVDALRAPWDQRTNVRNRLYELVDDGALICDDERPMRFALSMAVQ